MNPYFFLFQALLNLKSCSLKMKGFDHKVAFKIVDPICQKDCYLNITMKYWGGEYRDYCYSLCPGCVRPRFDSQH